MLLPVHEEIENDAEIVWTDRGQLPVEKIEILLTNQRQLAAFNDNDEAY